MSEPSRKAMKGASPARCFALRVLAEVRARDAFAADLLNARIKGAGLSEEDRGFARVLVLGVVSCVGSLDILINRCLRSPDDIQDDVRDALRISCYEIIYLQKSEFAAVSQGVELVKSIAPRAGGVANAVLRKVVSLKAEFPFGDPETDVRAMAMESAFPQWMAKALVRDMGLGEARSFMRVSNEPSPVFVYLNPLAAPCDESLQLLVDCKCKPVSCAKLFPGLEIPGSYQLGNPRGIADGRIVQAINRGRIIVSDASAQFAAFAMIDALKGPNLLEIGSGRGTKTVLFMAMAARCGKDIVISCVDQHSFKHAEMLKRVGAFGGRPPKTYCGDARKLDRLLEDERFDGVFVDAPCSGLGTLRRHPEIRWSLKPAAIDDLAEVGKGILRSAAGYLAHAGSMVYSTCTVTPRENQGQIVDFLKSDAGAGFALQPIGGSSCFAPLLRSNGPDAHFAVCLARK